MTGFRHDSFNEIKDYLQLHTCVLRIPISPNSWSQDVSVDTLYVDTGHGSNILGRIYCVGQYKVVTDYTVR